MPERKLKVKICGMREPSNIAQVAELRPDYMGFIFYNNSQRYVGLNFFLPELEQKEIKRTGVFVNANLKVIRAMVKVHDLQAVQLHGKETPELCSSLKDKDLEVIKAFQVNTHFDFDLLQPFKPFVHYFLFDTKSEQYGGSGKIFDWNLLKKYDQDVPFFLSGGISKSNLKQINLLTGMNLYAVDVNSGVEDSPGIKQPDKVKALIDILDKL